MEPYKVPLDNQGRVTLPKALREMAGIVDKVDIILTDKGLLVMPHRNTLRCAVTGLATEDLEVFTGGIVLSEEGREKLLEEILNSEIEKMLEE